jgi:hypothetical protein
MWIKVVRVLEPTSGVLECDSPAGRLMGTWRGSDLPVVGEVHDVELDLLGDLEWGHQVRVDERAEGVYGSDVVGLVEDVDGRGVTLRIAGAVALLDVVGDPPRGVVGQRVAIAPMSLSLFPTGI